jgi:hypothetical protein
MSILKQGEDDRFHLIGEVAVCCVTMVKTKAEG